MKSIKASHYSSSCMVIALLVLSLVAVIPPPVAEGQKQETLFSLVALAPNYTPPRRQWAQIIMNSFQNAGIDAKVVFVPYTDMIARIWGAPKELWFKTFQEGGYDSFFIGRTFGTPFVNPLNTWYGWPKTDFFPPYGESVYYWKSPEQENLNKILETWKTTVDPAVRDKAFKDWQKIIYDNEISIPILYPLDIMVVNPKVGGISTPVFPMLGGYERLTGKTEVIFASTADWAVLSPAYPGGFDSPQIMWAVFESLYAMKYDDTVLTTSSFVPRLARTIEATPDGKVWIVKIRTGIRWQDGVPLTADDIVWTAYYLTHPEAGSARAGVWTQALGKNPSFKWLNGTTTLLDPTKPKAGGSVEAVDDTAIRFALPEPMGTFHPELTTEYFGSIFPKHAYEPIGLKAVGRSTFNTGVGTVTITLPDGSKVPWKGPLGTGPYIFENWDPATKTVSFTKNPNYWNRAELESKGLFKVEKWKYVQIKEKEPAIAALKTGQVDILSYTYNLQKEWSEKVFDNEWSKTYSWASLLYQFFGLNMAHPVWGTGTATPLGKQDPSKAAEAARYVRLAMSHLIPRRLIVESIMGGAAQPGTVAHAPSWIGFDPSLPVKEYDPEKAMEYLRMAGYKVGKASTAVQVQPVNIQTTPITPAAPIGIPAGDPIKIPPFVLGMTLRLTGTSTNPATGQPYSQRIVVAQESTDQKTWRNIAQTTTDENGRYDMTVTPAQTGTIYYRLFLTPITRAEWGPAGVDPGVSGDEILKKFGFVGAAVYSEPVSVEVATLSDAFKWAGQLAQVKQIEFITRQTQDRLDQLTTSTTKSIDTLSKDVSTKLTEAATASSQLSKQLNTANTKIDTLTNQINTLNTTIYASIALATIGIIIGLVALIRKRT